MEKINLDNLGQDIYEFKMKNGLEVCLIPFKDKKNYYAILGTRYGSNDVEFEDMDGNKYKTPFGTAHFLEHKIFAQEDGEDPFAFFAKSGVNTNASTTFDNTRYYIWGVNDFKENLNYLLDFLLTPYFTSENVEKEKGIIKEEILMYEDNPEWALDDTMRKNLFYELPVKEKIAGDVPDIMQITKEDLYNAYNTFYHPSKMYLVIGGNIDIKETEKLLKKHEKLNHCPKEIEVKRKEYDEKDDVVLEYKELHMNIKVPKIRFSIKITKDKFKEFPDVKLNMYLGVIMSTLFGPTSLFKEKVTNESLTSGFYLEKNNFFNYLTLDITAESDKADILVEEIKKTYDNFKITKDDLERLKKVWIASEIRMIDSVEMTVDNIYSDLIMYNHVYTNRTEMIKSLNIKELNKIIKKLDLSNQSLVMILPKEKNM